MKRSLKYIAAALAAVTAMSCASVPAFATEPGIFTYENAVAGIQFGTLDILEDYVAQSRGRDSIPDVEPEVSDWLLNTDGIYIPFALKNNTNSISGILITPTYVSTMFFLSDVSCELRSYTSAAAGKKAYESAQHSAENGLEDAHKVHNLGRTIYFKKSPTVGEYYWTYGGEYFVLCVHSSDGFSEDAADMCGVYRYAFTASENGWRRAGGWDYYYKGGAPVTKATVIDGVLYNFGSDGVSKGKYTGWAKTSKGRRYYKDGLPLKNKWLKTKSGTRYYAGSDGYLVTGWKKFRNGMHWFDSKGAEATGRVLINGELYTFSASGVWDGIEPSEGEADTNPTGPDMSQIFDINGKKYSIDAATSVNVVYINSSGKLGSVNNGKVDLILPAELGQFDKNTCKALGKFGGYGNGERYKDAAAYLLPDGSILLLTEISGQVYGYDGQAYDAARLIEA